MRGGAAVASGYRRTSRGGGLCAEEAPQMTSWEVLASRMVAPVRVRRKQHM